MKISSTILALGLAQSATAFMGIQPNFLINKKTKQQLITPSSSALSSSTAPSSFTTADMMGSTSNPGFGFPGATAGDMMIQPMGGESTVGSFSATPRRRRGNTDPSITVQGGSLRTWSFADMAIERVNVLLSTDGRPLNTDIDLWHGPNNTPQKMSVYVDDGTARPFNAVVATPRGQTSAIAIRNTSPMEYPLKAIVEKGGGIDDSFEDMLIASRSESMVIQGGAIKSYSFGSPVSSVAVLLTTDGRPLNARLELLQGPDNNKQVVEIYCENGIERPFFAVIETPGAGNVLRVVNPATMEYPITASVRPHTIDPRYAEQYGEFLGGGNGNNNNNNRGGGGGPGGIWNEANDSSFSFMGGR